MRLINVKTYQVKEFIGNQIPWYAILSHTWEEEEVSFQDIQDLDEARQRKGFKKIKYLCGQAAEDGWDWAWMDTCCIDKTSSSELSEAINSMYKWYSEAMVCYVYLSDIESSSDWGKATTTIFTQPPPHPDFRPRWFRRGWTLQELIAPLRVHFYTADWCLLGSKKDLQEAIASMTGIATNVLRHEIHVTRVPIATRLYWASGRLTTRKEDMAYCLLGVFDINMPLLYGEGAKSFDRLLEQILNVTEDQTIFLTDLQLRNIIEPRDNPRAQWHHGSLLPSSVSTVGQSACSFLPVFSNQIPDAQKGTRERGVKINLLLRKLRANEFVEQFQGLGEGSDRSIYMAALNCCGSSDTTLLHDASKRPPKDLQRKFNYIQHSWGRFSPYPRYESPFRIIIFLQMITGPTIQPTAPTFIRLQPFYHILPKSDTSGWDFTTCNIIQSEKSLTNKATVNVEIRAGTIYRVISKPFLCIEGPRETYIGILGAPELSFPYLILRLDLEDGCLSSDVYSFQDFDPEKSIKDLKKILPEADIEPWAILRNITGIVYERRRVLQEKLEVTILVICDKFNGLAWELTMLARVKMIE